MAEEKQKIKFPCDWSYRIIVDSANEACPKLISKLLGSYGITTKPEKKDKSSNGKYQTYRVSVVFDSQKMMTELSSELAAIDGIKFML